MEKLIPRIREIAKKIAETESRRRGVAALLREASPKLGLFHSMEQSGLKDLKVVGVDGGMAKKSLHGMDCVLVRSVGACFHYQNSRIKEVTYYPSKIPPIQAEVTDVMSDIDWNYYTSIVRESSEVRTAISCIEKFRPDVLLMDGSIVPHHADKPARLSPAYQAYRSMLSEYNCLYESCISAGTMLAGIIEDSRAVRFCDIAKSQISAFAGDSQELVNELLGRTRDTNLLFWALQKGERTMPFGYCEDPKEHPILRDFDEKYSMRLNSLYLKTAELDRPIRVDYMKDRENTEDQIASILLAISGQHSSYGLPAPIIEADNVAKLSDNEMENFYFQILAFAGNLPSIMQLRRETRPF
ncbi:MAG: DNA double-strand break repair nuclease NurA [Candidatus Aenigmarchaeota archaeon]|nr:DNA double-strand break repair nuclease NurA [Candidatus Aenigmarchaeota archaeon]